MNEKETTPSYLELSNQAYGIVVDAFASANQRGLDYWRSVWEIVSRPYSSTAVDSNVRDNFERANQIVALSIGELQANGQRTSEVVEKLLSVTGNLQDSYVHSLRGLMKTGISNMNFVRETTELQFGDLAQRLDQIRPASAVSAN
jgi:hypothetical protein